jgi:hypothetical protein
MRVAFNSCTANPTSCNLSTLAVPGSTAYTNTGAFIEKLARNGLRGKPSPRDYMTFESVALSPDGTTATVQTCIFDAGVIYDPRGNGDPSDDVIVDDAIGSTQTLWTLSMYQGHWLPARGHVITNKMGVDSCGRPAG